MATKSGQAYCILYLVLNPLTHRLSSSIHPLHYTLLPLEQPRGIKIRKGKRNSTLHFASPLPLPAKVSRMGEKQKRIICLIMVTAQQQLCQPLGTFTGERPHSSFVGWNLYSDDKWEEVITRYHLGLSLVTPKLDALCDVYAYPPLPSCMQWIDQQQDVGHYWPNIARGGY